VGDLVVDNAAPVDDFEEIVDPELVKEDDSDVD